MTVPLSRRPEADLDIRLVGGGVRPWAVPLRQLARVLGAVQRLVDQSEADEEPAVIEPADSGGPKPVRTLHLLDVRSGSATYPVSVAEAAPALRLIRDTGNFITKPEAAEWTTATLSSIKELSEVAKSLGCVIEFRQPQQSRQLGDVLASISPDTYGEIAGYAITGGFTSVFATIERVGGATEMHCGIRLPSQPRKMVICHVGSADLVRKLGQYIYREVVVSGMAQWFRRDRQLKTMEIHSVNALDSSPISDVLEKIRRAGGDAWAKIEDPDAFIAELRKH